MSVTFRQREEALFAKWLQACIEKDGISTDEFARDGFCFVASVGVSTAVGRCSPAMRQSCGMMLVVDCLS